jgi:hypothetical protein
MVEVLPESNGNILVLRARGLLTHQDYRNVIIPRLEAMIRDHGKVRFLLDNFQGWRAVAFWDDARFGLIHRNDFEKIALIGGPKWILWALKLVALVVSGEMRTFSASERSKALSWIRAST